MSGGKLAAACAVMMGLAGCQFVPGTTAYYTHEARLALSDHVLDIDTAKITNVKTVQTSDLGTVICGSINGRNEFGAYSGTAPFAVSRDKKAVALVTPGAKPDAQSTRLIAACYAAKSWG